MLRARSLPSVFRDIRSGPGFHPARPTCRHKCRSYHASTRPAALVARESFAYLPQMHQNRSIQSPQPSVRSSQLLQLLLAEAKLLRIHVPQARHVLRFQSRERTALYKSMLGFAATLDHVRPDLSDRERLRYSVRWCAWAWQSKHKVIKFCSVSSPDWLRNLLWWTSRLVIAPQA